MALDFTLLTGEQVFGDSDGNGQLDVMKKYGTKVAPTDLALLLGAYMPGSHHHTTSETDLACATWSQSLLRGAIEPVNISYNGGISSCAPRKRCISARPVLLPLETKKLTPTNRRTGVNGVEIVEYGEYPQTIADEKTEQELREAFLAETLTLTGKEYTFDSFPGDTSLGEFNPNVCPECEYKGKKYIFIAGRPYDDDSLLSSGGVASEHPYWVEVQPIEWLVDPTGVWISKKALIGGIQFDTKETYDGDFSKTFMKHYLDTYFAKEIELSKVIDKEMLKGLNAKLAEISDLEKVKATVTPARTPERTDQLARITRVRRAKEILSTAAQKAQKEGDEATLQEIVELAKPYAARDAAIRDKFNLKRAERRAKKDRE